MFNEDAGTLVDNDGRRAILTKRGYDGTVVYGPYETLPAGRYLASVELSVVNDADVAPDTICARVDVAANYGATLYAHHRISWRDLKDRTFTATLLFELSTEKSLEYRVWSTGEVQLLVGDDWKILRLGDSVAGTVADQSGFPDIRVLPKPTAFVENGPELRRLYERGISYTVREDGFDMEYGGRFISGASQDDINSAGNFFRLGSNVNVSYAQMREDVILEQALHDVSRDDGFYIDVGANDPNFESVTRLFFDRGWRGINVEPSPDWISKLNEFRPRDINVQAALSDQVGEVEFHDIDGGQLGTLSSEFAERHQEAGMLRRSYTVPCLTLARLCEQYAPKTIHFLKVDVEGFEGAVLRGMDFERFRPWVLAIEATEPLRMDMLTHHDWDPLLRTAGYHFVLRDGVNRYYLADERLYLAERFTSPPTGYVRADVL